MGLVNTEKGGTDEVAGVTRLQSVSEATVAIVECKMVGRESLLQGSLRGEVLDLKGAAENRFTGPSIRPRRCRKFGREQYPIVT